MKINCKKTDLLEVLDGVNSVISERSPIPEIQQIKLQTQKDSIFIFGTDLEVGIRAEIKADIKEKGELLISPSRFISIIKETSDESIKIETKDNIAHIITKDGDYKIVGSKPEDFPEFPEFNIKDSIEISPIGLKEMIYKTVFAVSNEITRYALTGVLLEFDKKGLRMVTSDGKRLVYNRAELDQGITKKGKFIVSIKGINLLEKLVNDKQKLNLLFDESQIKINLLPIEDEYPKITMFSRLVEGVFPDYETIIPKDYTNKITTKKSDLYSALRRATVVTTDKFKAVKLTVENNKAILFSRAQDVGEAKVEIDIKYNGKLFEAVFNPDFLIDFLKIADESDLFIEIKDKTTPIVFKQGKDYLYLVMPMTLDM